MAPGWPTPRISLSARSVLGEVREVGEVGEVGEAGEVGEVGEALPKIRELPSQTTQLLQVERRQGCQPVLAARRQVQPDHSMVVVVPHASQQPGRLGAIDEAHDAVVAQKQGVCDVADLRPLRVVVAPHREQQLVLRRGQTCRSRLRLAPVLEAAQPGTQREEPAVDVIGQ